MLLFCSMMHVASGRVRRKTVSLDETGCTFFEKPILQSVLCSKPEVLEK